MNRPSLANVLWYAAALALGIVAVAPFVETNGQLILEPDMPLADIKLYYEAFVGAALPPPPPNVYFEGHSLIYALVARLVALVAGAPVDIETVAAAAINVVNAIAHVLATLVFFASTRRLARHNAAALVLTALFAISPQIIDIDLVRIDRLMLLPLMVILHESLRIAQGDPPRGIALGAALAVIAATKITGAAFAIFPLTAFVIVFAKADAAMRRRLIGAAGGAVAVGLPLFAVLMIRFVLHPATFINGLKTGYGMQMSWTSVFAFTPRFYYNFDLFLTYGALFMVLAALSFAVVAGRSRRDPVCLWLMLNVVLFSALGIAAFKYSRGGYHLVPLYLYGIAIAVRAVADYLPRRSAVLIAATMALLIPAGVSAKSFAQAADVALQRPQSIAASRFAARDWITAHFPPGARICMMGGSQWANPQLKGLGFHVSTQVFDFPYLDRATMAAFLPPRMDQVRAACDAIVFNDLHKTAYIGNFRTFGADARLKEWQGLLDDMAHDFPPKVFTAATPAYYVSRVEVYDLGHDVQRPDPATGPREQLTGAVDVVRRYGDQVSVQGWAADLKAQLAAGAIAIVADGAVVAVDGTGTGRRADVAAALKIPAMQAAGFSTCFNLPAAQAVTVLARGVDGVWGRIGPDKVEVSAGGEMPPWCQSQE